MNGARPTILLVDDSRDTLEPLKRLLTMCGYDVRTATTAGQAMALAADPRPADLIVSDLGLPDRSGADLMRDAKARWGMRGIVMTGFTGDQTIRECRSAGFERHLFKPFEFEDLREAVCEMLR